MTFSDLNGFNVFVDETYYLTNNPDVQTAVSTGAFNSGLEHFRLYGQNEGRQPVGGYDAAYYLTQNAEVVTANDSAEFILALEGNDIVLGLRGNDFLNGNQGNDEINGNQGNDTIHGGQDNDLVRGGQDNDRLFGDQGDDTLYGDLGADTVTGGMGNDIFAIGRNNDVAGFLSTGGPTLADADSITDFEDNQDLIHLTGQLTFEELDIFQGTGIYAGDTIIQDRGTSEYLAILKGVESTAIAREDFTEVSSPTSSPQIIFDPAPTPTPAPTQPLTPTPTPETSTVTFSAPTFTVNEDGTAIAGVTVSRTGDTSSAVSATVTPSDNTATAGNDYTADPIAVTFAAGETTQAIAIPIFDDSDLEDDETLILTLSNPTDGATLGAENTATLTIVDNDVTASPGTLAFSAPTYQIKEDGTAIAQVTVTRTGGSDGAVGAEVTLRDGSAIAPGDYANTPIPVSFASGDVTPKSIALAIADDAEIETTETAILELVNLTGGATLGVDGTAILEIADNDNPNNLELTNATYLGGAGNDEASAAVISPIDRAIAIAGNLNGAAQLLRFSPTGDTILSTTNLGTDVNDLDVDRDSGELIAVGDFGIKVFDSTGSTPIWSQPGIFDRVAIANDGTVATLTNSTDTITLWSATGTQLGTTTLTGTDIRPADLAINPTTNQVYVTGFNQVSGTLQTPFVRSFDSSLTPIWNTWDYSASEVTGQNLGADSRGDRITIGQDGGLYFLGKTDGGNNIYTRDGDNIATSLGTRLIQQDSYNNLSGAGSGSFTFFAKLDSNNGIIERGQFIATRLSSGQANSFTPNAIAADSMGNVYIGGSSAATLKDRSLKTINGQSVGNYTLEEMAVLGVSPDFTNRKFWTPLTATGDTDGAKGNVNAFAVGSNRAAIFGTVNSPGVVTTAGAINPNPLGGTDAYLATWVV